MDICLLRDEGEFKPGGSEKRCTRPVRAWIVVSAGDTACQKAAGVPGDKIVFFRRSPKHVEIRLALRRRHRQFNVESEPEMAVAGRRRTLYEQGRAGSRSVVKPDVDAENARKIATRQVREQVRHPHRPARAKSTAWPPKDARLEVVGIDRAHRQPVDRISDAIRTGVPEGCRAGTEQLRCDGGIYHPPSDLGGVWASRNETLAMRPRTAHRLLCDGLPKDALPSWAAKSRFETGPPDRAGNAALHGERGDFMSNLARAADFLIIVRRD